MKVFDKLEKICKSPYWQAMLDQVEKLVSRKYLREGESILSITPYDSGIQVILRGEDIEHITPWRERVGENPEPEKYTTFKTRTVHIWWPELERKIEGYYFAPDGKSYKTRQELVDAWNDTFYPDLLDIKATVDSWTEEQWETNWVKKEYNNVDPDKPF